MKAHSTLFILGLITLTVISCSYPSYNRTGYRNRSEGDLRKSALSWLNTPYRWGGMSEKGIDCSGLVCAIYRDVYGLKLPHQSAQLYRLGKPVTLRNIQPGDLVFFRTDKRRTVSHVGIYLGKEEFIHASSSRGVILSRLARSYYRKRLMGIRRLKKSP